MDERLTIGLKNFPALDPPDDHMMQCPWRIYSRFPWHSSHVSPILFNETHTSPFSPNAWPVALKRSGKDEYEVRERPKGAVTWFVSMGYRMKKFAQCIRGWVNYFGISEYYRPIPEIDHWLRRRVRMCYRKQWRYVRTRVRNLLGMGTHPNVAIPMSFSRKGQWKCARTSAT